MAHKRYQHTGMACVHKVPTEFIPIRDSTGKIVSCKVEEKSCVDYLGRYRNYPVAVEAKHEEGARIAFSRVEDHQAAYLDDFIKYPGNVALVVVSFGMRSFYAIPWEFWRVGRSLWNAKPPSSAKCLKQTVEAYGWRWTSPGMASVSEKDLLAEWRIVAGGYNILPYLDIIDKRQ